MRCNYKNNDQNIWKFWVSILGVIPVYIGTVVSFYEFLNKFREECNELPWVLVSLGYSFIYIIYVFFLILDYKEKDKKELEKNEEKDSWDRLKTRFAKEKTSLTRKSFLSFGFSSLQKNRLSKSGIYDYDIFDKPTHWDEFPSDHSDKYIIRYRKDKISFEIRFSSDLKKMLIRRTPDVTSSHFGDFKEVESPKDYSFMFWVRPMAYLKAYY